MTLSLSSLPAPLAVWDTRDPDGLWHCGGDIFMLAEAVRWAGEHIRDALRTYRVEFHLLDAPFAVVYRYALDDSGHVFAQLPDQEAVTEAPVFQALDDLPPLHLL